MNNPDPKDVVPKKLKLVWPIALAVVVAAIIGALVLQGSPG